MIRPDQKVETTLYYAWLHIPTGKEGVNSQHFLVSRTAAIKMLDALIEKWNEQQPNRWMYKRITSK